LSTFSEGNLMVLYIGRVTQWLAWVEPVTMLLK